MYSLDQVRRAITDPGKALTELNRLYHGRRGYDYNPAGVDVFEADWDTLVLLDACRLDAYADLASISGDLQWRLSRGATSAEFIRGNFGGRRLHDVVYVSANGWFPKLADDIDGEVHDFVLVERDAVGRLTSRPETVTDRALEVAETYPRKRLVVHYMQPHQPYLGRAGERLTFGSTLGETVERNDMTREEVVAAYRENARLALDAVERLVDELSGKTVISADHGEQLGERTHPLPVRFYGHMDSLYTDELVRVPWHVVENGDRREIEAEPPTDARGDVDIEAVEQNLADLGYRV